MRTCTLRMETWETELRHRDRAMRSCNKKAVKGPKMTRRPRRAENNEKVEQGRKWWCFPDETWDVGRNVRWTRVIDWGDQRVARVLYAELKWEFCLQVWVCVEGQVVVQLRGCECTSFKDCRVERTVWRLYVFRGCKRRECASFGVVSAESVLHSGLLMLGGRVSSTARTSA